MQNILVPTDFSSQSYHALSLAKKIASKTKATIHLVHVITPFTRSYSSLKDVFDHSQDVSDMLEVSKKLKNYLEQLKKGDEDNLYSILTDVKIGSPYEEIEKMSLALNVDLVIIGTKGTTDSEDFFMGSIADKIIRSIKYPVISVKKSADDIEFRNLVYATDLLQENEPLLMLMVSLQKIFDSNIHIVKINTKKGFTNDIDTRVKLEKLADKYELENYTLSSYSHEDEEYGVIYFADEKQADLIAIGIHEKSGFRRLISGGSLALEVSDHSYRPVLTCHFKK